MTQTKNTKTTRSLSKSLGTASLLSLAVAGANVANAMEMDWGAEYRATAFALQSDSYEAGGRNNTDTDNGLAHLIRLKGDLKHESGVSLHTSIEVAGDRWRGDDRKYTGTGADDTTDAYNTTGAYNGGNRGDNVRLDLGYVTVPLEATGGFIRVGRQAANWNNCLLVCDDRRDRILTVTPTAIGSIIALYDRRQDTARAQNEDNGDMISLGLVTKLGDFNAGFLWVHWFKNFEGNVGTPEAAGGQRSYVLQDAHIISPYLDGTIADGAVRLAGGFNYVGQGAVEGPAADLYFQEDTFSYYLRAGTDAGPVTLDLQYVAAQDGGLISNGFDTYSSLISNNPESTANPTSVYGMGSAFGRTDFDESLIIARAGFDVSPTLNLSASIGNMTVDNGTNDDSSMVYDARATYKLSDNVTTFATVGMLAENEVGSLSENDLAGADVTGGFEDVVATSLNLVVNF